VDCLKIIYLIAHSKITTTSYINYTNSAYAIVNNYYFSYADILNNSEFSYLKIMTVKISIYYTIYPLF